MDILIIKPSSLGDIIHGLQFAESLRSEIDNARISWVSRELFAPLVQSCRTVHYTHIFHRKGSILGFVKLIREIRQVQFDWVLDLQGLLRSGILCKGARAKNKAGRSDAREGARWLYPFNVPLPPTGAESHALEILMEFKRLFGQEPTGLPPIRFDAALGQASRDALSTPPAERLMIFLESRRAEKEWPYFQTLTGMLLEQTPDLQLIWVATNRIEPQFPASRFEASGRFVNLSGRTTIDELPPLIDSSDLVLANDSGPMHLAAAMQKEVVALFGPTDPNRYGPWGQLHNVLAAPDGDLRNLPTEQVAECLRQKLAAR